MAYRQDMDSEDESDIVGAVKAVSSTFKWEIDRYTLRSVNNEGFFDSPRFKTKNVNEDVQWLLRLFPKGNREVEGTEKHVSLYIYSDTKIQAVVSLAVLSRDRKIWVDTFEEREYGETGVGYPQFVSQDALKQFLLDKNKVVIVCKIEYSSVMYNNETNEEVKQGKKNLLFRLEGLDNYEALLDDARFSDVTLLSEGKKIKVHKCILANSSPVFAAMFNSNKKEEQKNTINVSDVRFDMLLEIIRFIYTRKVNNIEDSAAELAEAAFKYSLDELKNMCEKTLKKNVCVENVNAYLQLGDRLGMEKLRNKAFRFIIKNQKDIVSRRDFNAASREILREEIRRMGINVNA